MAQDPGTDYIPTEEEVKEFETVEQTGYTVDELQELEKEMEGE